MKFLLILTLALSFSCTTKKKETKTSKPATPEFSAGESEGGPVSPYTVQPCYCMKIFSPVCADGQNFPNSCEAQCHGHKKWTEGPCGKKK